MGSKEDLEELKKNMMEMVENNQDMKGFLNYVETAEKADTLDTKTKEMMSLAIGVVLRCDHCIKWHTDACIEAGVSEEEFKDALEIAVVMGGGPALAYATEAYKIYKEMKEE